MFPANVLQDRAFDQLARRRFFKGIEFDAPSGDPGWFGPDSAVWYVHEHVPALVLGLFAAALIETLHPDFAWMGRDHSRGIERVDGVPTGRIDPEGALVRAGHSYSFFMAVAYGSTRSAEQVVRAVSGMHHTVRGVRPDGRRYDADDPETLRWAYATVVWGIAAAHSRYHARPLRGAALDRYFAEFTRVGEALGGTALPATKADVDAYLHDNVGLMGVTLPTVAFLDSVGGRGQPRAIRPIFRELQWAAIDLQPAWAKRLLRTPRFEPAAPLRRAAIWATLNGIRYGAGPLKEVEQARRRVGTATVLPTPEPADDALAAVGTGRA
jgi:uncharacterized protein (DUF2236 family)